MTITNCRVYDLEESIIACRNAMRLEPAELTDGEFEKSLQRAIKLVHASQQSAARCHDSFLCGIRVAFDLKYPNYLSPELQRYHFLDIVCSSSKMHRLVNMNMDTCFNEWVTDGAKEMMKRLISEYNRDMSEDNFMRVISNCPQGIELFMRCTTNYKQLQTIYAQRKRHRLPEWRAFCKWIETLPYSQELLVTR